MRRALRRSRRAHLCARRGPGNSAHHPGRRACGGARQRAGGAGAVRGGMWMITLEEQIAEARRELALRRKVYPAWGKSGQLDKNPAPYQLQAKEENVKT